MIRQPGDPVEIGTEISISLESDLLTHRLVGILHNSKGMAYVLRRYEPDDVIGIPTGDYCRGGLLFPWDPGPAFRPGFRQRVRDVQPSWWHRRNPGQPLFPHLT